MTKKLVKLFGLAMLCLCLFGTAGCGNYKHTALKDNPAADAEVQSQGGAVVKKGDYLYTVNGIYASDEANEYGTPTKGNIYRIKIGAEGNLVADGAELLCPKQVYSATETSGLFLSGDRIYFASPSDEKDRKGQLLTSYLDLFSVKLDGTDLKKIAYLTSNSFTAKWIEENGKVYYVYIDSTDSKVCSIDSSNGKTTTVAEKYVNTPIFGEGADHNVYYQRQVAKADQEGKVESDIEYETAFYATYCNKMTGGTEECLMAADHPVVDKQFSLSITRAENGYLYYSKTVETVASLYAYKIDTETEILLSINVPTTIHKYLGFDADGKSLGLIATYESKISLIQCKDGKMLPSIELMSTSPTTMLKVDDTDFYYTDGSKIYRKAYVKDGDYNSHVKAEELYEGAVNTSTFMPEFVDSYVYFLPTGNKVPNYMYRMPVTPVEIDEDAPEVVMVEQLVGKYNEADQKTFKKLQDQVDKNNKKNGKTAA